MNERIKLLAERARFIDRGSNHTAYMSFDHEKYTELIIQECTQACVDKGNTYEVKSAGEYQSTIFADAIKKHFGIKE